MTKMEIEFTDEQLEKVKKLEAHDISVGEAIDMLFEARDKISSIIDDIDAEKLEDADASNDSQETTKKTYDMAIEDVKSHVSWANTFFKL